jgi:four helix bundle protein
MEKAMAGKNYRDLIAWQKAMAFVEEVYKASAHFPREEIYTLTAQLRRAAISIPSSIAEGQGRQSRREFRNFLRIAHGSLREVETQILLAEPLRYVDASATIRLMQISCEIGRLLNGLIRSLSREA